MDSSSKSSFSETGNMISPREQTVKRKNENSPALSIHSTSTGSFLKIDHDTAEAKEQVSTPTDTEDYVVIERQDLNMPKKAIEISGPGKPMLNFRPEFWRYLDVKQKTLNIDVFWPIDLKKEAEAEAAKLARIKNTKAEDTTTNEDDDSDDKNVFPVKELEPLMQFRNLEYLQLGGMMQSYQPIIWATCWANPRLATLHLEMALEPDINVAAVKTYTKIDAKWAYKHVTTTGTKPPKTEYLGAYGEGTLHEEFGDGEYLDQYAIERARATIFGSDQSNSTQRLSMVRLVLRNFAVDSGPFFKWFDAKKLREIDFVDGCVDLGFAMPDEMVGRVRVLGGRPAMGVARRVKPGEVKLVEIKKKKVKGGKGSGSASGTEKKVRKKLSELLLPKRSSK